MRQSVKELLFQAYRWIKRSFTLKILSIVILNQIMIIKTNNGIYKIIDLSTDEAKNDGKMTKP